MTCGLCAISDSSPEPAETARLTHKTGIRSSTVSPFADHPEHRLHIQNRRLIHRLKIADMDSVAIDGQDRHPMQPIGLGRSGERVLNTPSSVSLGFSTRVHVIVQQFYKLGDPEYIPLQMDFSNANL
jgi:hypothetical protein